MGLALACLVTFLANELWMWAVGLFMLRQFGQGLSSHTGMTATSRAYQKNRGRAAAPVLFGVVVDAGFDFQIIAFGCVCFVSLATLLAFAAGRDTLSIKSGRKTHD